ncbi:hypothetical protein [Lysinibacillus piscis]|uniref:Uncharacterized protein n=1 Tax=Lysinibacillus piscis TaxID=2518931 RepID=A0ABQ5NI94_9BACI|nr:hypothetical protein [Lysinibacillus sp. KH24]GLC88091.1 hypothetical protein LYSBPC_12180 [Lysinibacillus sp. KH24]
MQKVLNSTFETYLMDQEVELSLESDEQEESNLMMTNEQYPAGFFTSL